MLICSISTVENVLFQRHYYDQFFIGQRSYCSVRTCKCQNLSNIDFSQTTFYNVSFVAVDMRNSNLSSIKYTYCYFANITFKSVTLKNASFHHSRFIDCLIDDKQLAETFDLTGSTLSNGTVVYSLN